MMTLFLLLLIALVVLAVMAVRNPPWSAGRGVGHPQPGSARDMLDQRLVRGEVSPEEYRATRALLEE